MNSYSQVGQDRFAHVMSGLKNDGLFIDVGCSDGQAISNSLALEEIGWHGLLVDIAPQPATASRRSRFIQCDAAVADWENLLPPAFDYLSLDVDDATCEALERITAAAKGQRVFGCATIEHDAYRIGDRLRERQRKLMLDLGYDLVCSDICIENGLGAAGQGGPFEDWWVNPDYASKELRDKYRCHGRLGKSVALIT